MEGVHLVSNKPTEKTSKSFLIMTMLVSRSASAKHGAEGLESGAVHYLESQQPFKIKPVLVARAVRYRIQWSTSSSN